MFALNFTSLFFHRRVCMLSSKHTTQTFYVTDAHINQNLLLIHTSSIFHITHSSTFFVPTCHFIIYPHKLISSSSEGFYSLMKVVVIFLQEKITSYYTKWKMETLKVFNNSVSVLTLYTNI